MKNRMKSRTISVPDATETVLVGAGFEGVLNGARGASVTIGPVTSPLTIRFYRRANADVNPAPDLTTDLVPADSATHTFDETDLAGLYELTLRGTQSSGAAINVPVSWRVD